MQFRFVSCRLVIDENARFHNVHNGMDEPAWSCITDIPRFPVLSPLIPYLLINPSLPLIRILIRRYIKLRIISHQFRTLKPSVLPLSHCRPASVSTATRPPPAMPLLAQNPKPRVILGLMTFGPDQGAGARITSLDDYNKNLDYFQSQGYSEVGKNHINHPPKTQPHREREC